LLNTVAGEDPKSSVAAAARNALAMDTCISKLSVGFPAEFTGIFLSFEQSDCLRGILMLRDQMLKDFELVRAAIEGTTASDILPATVSPLTNEIVSYPTAFVGPLPLRD